MPPLPPSNFRSVRRETQCQQKKKQPSTALLLANCAVLFRGYMSAQAVIVSVIITTCSPAPFRFRHLRGIKQPAAGSSVDCPGAATVRPRVSEHNCRPRARIALASSPPSPPGIGKEKTQPFGGQSGPFMLRLTILCNAGGIILCQTHQGVFQS